MNPLNRELRDVRIAIEHYNRILQEDVWISIGELEDDGRPKLSELDKKKINNKLEILEEKKQELLAEIRDIPKI